MTKQTETAIGTRRGMPSGYWCLSFGFWTVSDGAEKYRHSEHTHHLLFSGKQGHPISLRWEVEVKTRINVSPHWLHSTGQQTLSPTLLAPSMPESPLLHVGPDHWARGGLRGRNTSSCSYSLHFRAQLVIVKPWNDVNQEERSIKQWLSWKQVKTGEWNGTLRFYSWQTSVNRCRPMFIRSYTLQSGPRLSRLKQKLRHILSIFRGSKPRSDQSSCRSECLNKHTPPGRSFGWHKAQPRYCVTMLTPWWNCCSGESKKTQLNKPWHTVAPRTTEHYRGNAVSLLRCVEGYTHCTRCWWLFKMLRRD